MHIEQLERRDHFSNITVAIRNRKLIVRPDTEESAFDYARIKVTTRNSAISFTLYPVAYLDHSDTFNGNSSVSFPSVDFDSIKFYLGDNDTNIHFDRFQTDKPIGIYSGNKTVNVFFKNSSIAAIDMVGGTATDTFAGLSSTFSRPINLSMGSAFDRIDFSKCRIRRGIKIDGGADRLLLTLSEVTSTGNIIVLSSSTSDQVVVSDSIIDQLDIATGDGDDDLRLEKNYFHSEPVIDLGGGNNTSSRINP